jgi:hypothetical protein
MQTTELSQRQCAIFYTTLEWHGNPRMSLGAGRDRLVLHRLSSPHSVADNPLARRPPAAPSHRGREIASCE